MLRWISPSTDARRANLRRFQITLQQLSFEEQCGVFAEAHPPLSWFRRPVSDLVECFLQKPVSACRVRAVHRPHDLSSPSRSEVRDPTSNEESTSLQSPDPRS